MEIYKMAKKSIRINNCEADMIKNIKKQVLKLGSTKTCKVKEVISNLNYLENKFQNNIQNFDIVESSRNLDDVVMQLHFTDELKWFYDLLLNRSGDYNDVNPKHNMSKEELENVNRIATKFNIKYEDIDPYTHGLLHGKSIVLHWILGEDWDCLHS